MKSLLAIAAVGVLLSACGPKQAEPAPAPTGAETAAVAPSDAVQTVAPPSDMTEEGGPHGPPAPDPLPKN